MLGLTSNRRQQQLDQASRLVLLMITLSTVLVLVLIFVFLLWTGMGVFKYLHLFDFLLNPDWNPTAYLQPSYGIFSLILGTVLVSGVALAVSLPISLAIAIYLAEIASRHQREVIKPLIEMIAAIPSVVIGVLGLTLISPLIAQIFSLNNGLNALTAGILVGMAALPAMASLAEDALFNVSWSLREASLALGATSWETIKKVVLPAARPGLVATVMLGLGRIIGETMIVLMVAGNSRALPKSLFAAVSPMTSTIAVDIKEVVTGSLHYQSLFAIGLVLFGLTFLLNLLADLFSNHD